MRGGLEQVFNSSPDTSQLCDLGDMGPLFGTSVPHQ